MAFTYSSRQVCESPWIIREIIITSTDTTAEALTHGGPATIPAIVIPVLESANPTASELSVTAKSTTTVTVDAEAGSKAARIYCIWLDAASGGIS